MNNRLNTPRNYSNTIINAYFFSRYFLSNSPINSITFWNNCTICRCLFFQFEKESCCFFSPKSFCIASLQSDCNLRLPNEIDCETMSIAYKNQLFLLSILTVFISFPNNNETINLALLSILDWSKEPKN